MLIVPIAAAVVFYFVFYGYLVSRPKKMGERVDRGRARLVALLVAFVVLVLLWYLLIYLASKGIFAGVRFGL